jgi:surface antigen
MSEADRAHNREAENRASHAPIGQMVTWNNPADGNSGTIVAMHDGYSPSGAYCREYRQSVTIAGQQRQGQVKACQQADGGWKAAQ